VEWARGIAVSERKLLNGIMFMLAASEMALYPCRRNNTVVLLGVAVFETNTSVCRFVFPPEGTDKNSSIVVDATDFMRPKGVGMVLDSEPATFLFPPSRNK